MEEQKRSIIEEIKSKVDLEGGLAQLGVHIPNWKPYKFSARCFFGDHDDRHPSMTIYPEDGRVKCHGCGRGGDILDCTRSLLNTDTRGAIAFWADRLGIDRAKPDEETKKHLDEAVKLRQLKECVHKESLIVEQELPKPRSDTELEILDYLYEEKDALDARYRDCRDNDSLKAYLRELWEWRRWARGVLVAALPQEKFLYMEECTDGTEGIYQAG